MTKREINKIIKEERKIAKRNYGQAGKEKNFDDMSYYSGKIVVLNALLFKVKNA